MTPPAALAPNERLGPILYTDYTNVLPDIPRMPSMTKSGNPPRADHEVPGRRHGRLAPSVARVLVVEDDARVREELERGLAATGFEVIVADDAASASAPIEQGSVDLMVLDLGLPDGDGFDLLLQRGDAGFVPVIVLTASSDETTRIRAFELGAIDYMAKPFFMAELVARIRARLGTASANPEPQRRRIFADVVVDLDARTVAVADEAIDLTRTEFDLLTYLVERPGRALSRGALAEFALDPSGDRFDRTVDSHISRLRGKLGPIGREHVRTVWGIGWRFDP